MCDTSAPTQPPVHHHAMPPRTWVAACTPRTSSAFARNSCVAAPACRSASACSWRRPLSDDSRVRHSASALRASSICCGGGASSCSCCWLARPAPAPPLPPAAAAAAVAARPEPCCPGRAVWRPAACPGAGDIAAATTKTPSRYSPHIGLQAQRPSIGRRSLGAQRMGRTDLDRVYAARGARAHKLAAGGAAARAGGQNL